MSNRKFWGVAAIIIGLVALLEKTDSFLPTALYLLEKFWPLFFILIGLLLVFHVPKAIWLGLGILLIIGLALGDATWERQIFWEENNRRSVSHHLQRSVEGLKALDVELRIGAGEIEIDSLNQGLYEANLKGYRVKAPRKQYTVFDRTGKLTIHQDLSSLPTSDCQWDLYFSKVIPLRVSMFGGATKMDLDFREIPLEELNINAGAGKFEVRLGGKVPSVQLDFNLAASEITITVPESAQVHIGTGSPLIETRLENSAAWVRKNGRLQYPGDETGPVFNITVNSVAAKLNVNFS